MGWFEAAPAEIGEIGEPLGADEHRLAAEELAVGAAALADDRALPFPDPLALVREPDGGVDMLRNGKAGDRIAEKGEEADCTKLILVLKYQQYSAAKTAEPRRRR